MQGIDRFEPKLEPVGMQRKLLNIVSMCRTTNLAAAASSFGSFSATRAKSNKSRAVCLSPRCRSFFAMISFITRHHGRATSSELTG